MALTPTKNEFRVDIQALRGIAVLLVVFYHAGLGSPRAGYLGVDVFFVVSGFLITRIIASRLEVGTFSFAEFYTRRVKRLLPAAYTTLLLCTFAAFFLLTSSQYVEYFEQLFGSVAFVANFVLWFQVGYFHPASAFHPLLHMWSLAIEEQYYLFLPLTLTLIPRRWWFALICLATVGSFVAYILITMRSPSAAFYFTPTRAWELGIGSFATFLAHRNDVMIWARKLLPIALLVLLLVPFWPLETTQVNYNPLFVCLATVVIILAKSERINGNSMARGLGWVGNFSYSLYLIHWPLFSFVHIVYNSEELPTILSLALVAIAMGLARLMYCYIEEPARKSALQSRRLIAASLAGTALILALGAGGLAWKNQNSHRFDLAPAEGLPVVGCFANTPTLQPKCVESDEPKIAVWGDSYATHLIDGLSAESQYPLAQLTKGQCGAMFGYAALAAPNERNWTEGCLSFNDDVFEFLASRPSIEIVVISTRYSRYFDPSGKILRQSADGAYSIGGAGINGLLEAQLASVERIRELGKRVIVVSPLPAASFDVGQCWSRRAESLVSLGPNADCILSGTGLHETNAETRQLLDAFERSGLPVIRLDQALCSEGQCVTSLGGHPIYRDTGHMSPKSSELVARHIDLGTRVMREAK